MRLYIYVIIQQRDKKKMFFFLSHNVYCTQAQPVTTSAYLTISIPLRHRYRSSDVINNAALTPQKKDKSYVSLLTACFFLIAPSIVLMTLSILVPEKIECRSLDG